MLNSKLGSALSSAHRQALNPVFSVQQLAIASSEKTLVKHLSFSIRAAERWVVLGANGCGKSSLLHACAGLPIAARTVQFESIRFGAQSFQATQCTPAALAPLRSVCPQRIDWNMALSPTQLADLMGIVPRVAAQGFELPSAWLHQSVSQRSGGEQQRIAIALTTAQTPAMCFLDEPLTHLDEVQQVQTLMQLKTLSQTTGKAMLMVSHHIRLSMAWASHAVLPADDADDAEDADDAGMWLAGEVDKVCTPQNIAKAYGISIQQAQQLLLGQMQFKAV